MKNYLINNVLPFWIDNSIDEECGGIFTQLDREGNIYGTEKSVWFQGRALYIFSVCYNEVEKNEKYLDAAKKIYEFLFTYMKYRIKNEKFRKSYAVDEWEKIAKHRKDSYNTGKYETLTRIVNK